MFVSLKLLDGFFKFGLVFGHHSRQVFFLFGEEFKLALPESVVFVVSRLELIHLLFEFVDGADFVAKF